MPQEMPDMTPIALYYQSIGFSVIPINPKNKKPLVPWKEYQSRVATRDEIREWWAVYPHANIGIVTGSISGVVVVDADSEGSAQAFAALIGDDQMVTPTVKTPRGYHFYFKYPVWDVSNQVNVMPDVDIRGEGGYVIAPQSTLRNEKGQPIGQYSWLTELGIHQVHLREAPEYLRIERKGPQERTFVPGESIPKGSRNDILFHRALIMARGGATRQEIEHTIRQLAKSCNPPYPEAELPALIESAVNRKTSRVLPPVAEVVREFVDLNDVPFNMFEINRYVLSCLRSKGLQDSHGQEHAIYKSIAEEMRRLKAAGKVMQNNTRGTYRRVESDLEIIDLGGDMPDPLGLTLPFGEEKLVNLYPRNIIVVAGEPNAGKTAYMLNVAKNNRLLMPVYYFSSEMGRDELRLRMKWFDDQDWKGVFFAERASNFADVIRPDAINIIDYLEISDEFYRVGGMIKEIFDKLKSGVAFIALQKNEGTDYGMGGMRSIEKPRLYLAMEPGKIKMVKAKNFASDNPNGKSRLWKLVNGCKFIPQTEWLNTDSGEL